MSNADKGAIIWVHEDALGLDHPVFAKAKDNAQRIFIWDDSYFQAQGYSLKRLVFIYECLLDIPRLQLYHGDMKTILGELCKGQTVFVAETPNPTLQDIIKVVSENCDTTLIGSLPFVQISDNADMRRFFRYWNRAKKSAVSMDGIRVDG